MDHSYCEQFLHRLKAKPMVMTEIMRRNGIVIKDHNDPMQKLAFTLYTELVQIASEAEQLLGEDDDEK